MNAAYFVPLVGITLMAIGLIGVGAAAWRNHTRRNRLDFIRSLGSEAETYAEPVQMPDRVQTPLVNRHVRPGRRAASATACRASTRRGTSTASTPTC